VALSVVTERHPATRRFPRFADLRRYCRAAYRLPSFLGNPVSSTTHATTGSRGSIDGITKSRWPHRRPNGGRARALCSNYGTHWQIEGGKGTKGRIVKFQIRPNPLAQWTVRRCGRRGKQFVRPVAPQNYCSLASELRSKAVTGPFSFGARSTAVLH